MDGGIRGVLQRALERASFDRTLSVFLSRLAYMLVLAFVVVMTIQKLGVDTTSFAAVIAAGGLAIGLALQGSLSNFASGVMLIALRPFKLGDSSVDFVVRPWVKAGDYWPLTFDLNERIKLCLDDEGISIPFPQRDIHVHQVGESKLAS